MQLPPWTIEIGDSPLVATAIHAGHEVRPEVAPLLAINEQDRLREEDPLTHEWTFVAPTRVIVHHSRFEFDLNRPEHQAIYMSAADAWGLRVWKTAPPAEVVGKSLSLYRMFYAEMRQMLSALVERQGRVVVLDIHSYNHRRGGSFLPPAPEAENPRVNIGTGSLDRGAWGGVVDRFIGDLAGFDFPGGGLDVRENVKFTGGNFPRWIHAAFPDSVCALAIEFKKTFMDEWTGEVDGGELRAIYEALESTVPGVLEELRRL